MPIVVGFNKETPPAIGPVWLKEKSPPIGTVINVDCQKLPKANEIVPVAPVGPVGN